MKRFTVVLSLFILICLLASLCACGSSNRAIDAWVCAQNVVESRLKAPSTAKFCSYTSATVTDLGNDKYRISGYVDSQNGFGAMIRSNFTVTLTLTEHGYKDATCTIN